MEHEYIVDHGVDLREHYLIMPRPQVWRNVEEFHVRLSDGNGTSVAAEGECKEDIYLVRRVQNRVLVVDQEP